MKNELSTTSGRYAAPWRLATLAVGIVILIFGSYYEGLGDWDVGMSILMALLTYFMAPFVCEVIWRRKWRMLPLAAFCAWLAIDGSYVGYNLAIGHPFVREANAIASTPLFFICGLFWLWDGKLPRRR